MCELLGVSSSIPVSMTYALHEFAPWKLPTDWGNGFSAPRPPGLSMLTLKGADLSARGLQVEAASKDIAITAVASVPLTKDSWEPVPEGTLLALHEGHEVARISI